jgi:hypothetical protein
VRFAEKAEIVAFRKMETCCRGKAARSVDTELDAV